MSEKGSWPCQNGFTTEVGAEARCGSELMILAMPLIVAISILANDRADVLAAQRGFQELRFESVDDLELLHLARAGKEVDQNAIEWQRRQIAGLQFAHGNLFDECGIRVGLGVRFVKTIDIFDQRVGGAAVALRQQETSRIGAMRRDAADARRVLPDGERGIAVTDHARSRLDEEGQHMPEDFRRDRDYAVRRKQSAE